MRRIFFTALIAGAVLFAIAGLPATSTDSVLTSFTSSAQAQKLPTNNATNLNSSKSNVNKVNPGGRDPPDTPGVGTNKSTTIKTTKSTPSE